MEYNINIQLLKNKKIEKFVIRVNSENQRIVKEKLKIERINMIKHLRKLQSKGLIKSDRRPKNKDMQIELDNLVIAKRKLRDSIEKINLLF